MKFLLAATAFLGMVSSLWAEEGTLTLSGEKILFVTASGTKSYPVQPGGTILEGAKFLEFKPKRQVKGDDEIDVSELILEIKADGSKLTLVNEVPLKVARAGEGDTTTWKPVKK